MTDDARILHLRELISALDRRFPHLERAGEEEIARDAEALRETALRRIREIELELAGSETH